VKQKAVQNDEKILVVTLQKTPASVLGDHLVNPA
jgi:hypothetical protein